VELEKDGWELVDTVWCQGAQDIGLWNYELKSALKWTVWSQCTPYPDRQTDGRTSWQQCDDYFVLTSASRAKTCQFTPTLADTLSVCLCYAMQHVKDNQQYQRVC